MSEIALKIYNSLNIKSSFYHWIIIGQRGPKDTLEHWLEQVKNGHYVYPCCLSMNSYVSDTVGYFPNEIVFLIKALDLFSFDFDPDRQDIKRQSGQYALIIMVRFKLWKVFCYERKALQQECQRIREMRKYSNHKEFAIETMIYFSMVQVLIYIPKLKV